MSSIVLKNNQGLTPLDIAIKYDYPKCVNLLLEYLCNLKDGNYSRQIYHLFPTLMEKGYSSFYRFLDSWMYQTAQMKNIKYLSLGNKDDVFMTAHSNCLLDRHFFEKYTQHGGEQKKLRDREIALHNTIRSIK